MHLIAQEYGMYIHVSYLIIHTHMTYAPNITSYTVCVKLHFAWVAIASLWIRRIHILMLLTAKAFQ